MYFQFPNSNLRVIGSMHMLPADRPTMPSWVLEAYEWCEAVAFESDPSTLLPLLHPTPNVNLQEFLSPLCWSTLSALWPAVPHIPRIDAVQPWAVLLFSSVFASRTVEGVEPQFLRRSAEQSKPVSFLESAVEVVASFDSAPHDEVCKAIELLASDLSAPQKAIDSMYCAWLNQDLPALYAVAEKSPAFQSAALRQAILERRNKAWVPSFLNLMKSPKRTLVAVGALHLCGPGNLLQQAGGNAQRIQSGG